MNDFSELEKIVFIEDEAKSINVKRKIHVINFYISAYKFMSFLCEDIHKLLIKYEVYDELKNIFMSIKEELLKDKTLISLILKNIYDMNASELDVCEEIMIHIRDKHESIDKYISYIKGIARLALKGITYIPVELESPNSEEKNEEINSLRLKIKNL